MAGLELKERGSTPARGREFSVYENFQAGSGNHQTSYSVGTEVFSPVLERSERDADHLHPRNTEVKNALRQRPLPPYVLTL